MTKELTPEEKKAFGVDGADAPVAGGLTPEQIAKNLENQKHIAEVQAAAEKEPVPTETQNEARTAASFTENEIDLDAPAEDVPTALEAGSIKLDDDIASASESDIIDLDNVLDKAEHTYELEEDEITSAPSAVEDMHDDLEQQLAGTVPIDPEREALEKQAALNKQESETKAAEKDMSHVRTLHKDVSTLRDTGNTAVTARMLRETRREEQEQKEDLQTDSQIKVLSILSVAFLVVAIGLVVYLTQFNKPTTTALDTTTRVPSLVPADTQVPIDVTGSYHFKIKSTVAEEIAKQTEFKKLAHFYFGEASRNGGRLLTTSDFFRAVNINIPTSLQEVLTDEFMFGTYTVQEPTPFIILPVTSFPKAQQAMAAWEGNMLRDLKDLFALPEENIQPEAFDGVFRDSLIENQHVRLLYTPLIETLEETFIVPIPEPEEELVETEEETPSELEIFTQCIADSGATFFGASWCPHCNEQKELFGETAVLLPYQECSIENTTQQNELCTLEGITEYPTWEFADESRVSGTQTFEALSEKTGCALPEIETVTEETDEEIVDEEVVTEPEEESDETEEGTTEEQSDMQEETGTPESAPEDTVNITPEPQQLLQTQRIMSGEDLALVYTFINEFTILITTDPAIIPEIVKRYTNRQIFLQ